MFGVHLCDSEISIFISGIQQVFNYVEGRESGEGRGKRGGGEGRREEGIVRGQQDRSKRTGASKVTGPTRQAQN